MNTFRAFNKLPIPFLLVGVTFLAVITVTGCASQHAGEQSVSTGYVPVAKDFLQQWVILDPISINGLNQSAVRSQVEREYFPNQLTVVPNDGDKVTIDGKEHVWHAVDYDEYNFNLYYFSAEYGTSSSNVLYWVVTTVDCPEAIDGVRLTIGTNAASVWWVNGEEVIGIYNDRQATIDDGVSPPLTLKKGRNVIRGAVINGGGATDFCARLIGSDELPLKGYTVTIGD